GTCTPFAISISSCLFLTSYLSEGAPMGRKERRQLAQRKSPRVQPACWPGFLPLPCRTSPDIGRRPRVRSAGPQEYAKRIIDLLDFIPDFCTRRNGRRALYAATAVLADTSCQCRSTASQVRYLLGYRRAKAQMRREHNMAARWDDEIAEL